LYLYIFFVFCALDFNPGEVAEWSKAHAWKACIPSESVSRVRIPLSPQNGVSKMTEVLVKGESGRIGNKSGCGQDDKELVEYYYYIIKIHYFR
jgi:hypothetical protein